jgi:hypothetical protein
MHGNIGLCIIRVAICDRNGYLYGVPYDEEEDW